MKQLILNHLKNIRGWRTRRRLVVMDVDDYGNVRLASAEARDALVSAGLKVGDAATNPFDRYDSLETREDLEALFEVLASVTDSSGRPAIFTVYALSANPDFARIIRDMDGYHHEWLPDTFARLASTQPTAYQGAWELWQEGMARGFIRPQFHGREHLHLGLFGRKMGRHDPTLMANLHACSMAALGGDSNMPDVGFTHAFGLISASELESQRAILADGLEAFERIFGFRSITFTPPAQQLHPALYSFVEQQGVLGIDKELRCIRALGDGVTRREINHLGRQRGQGHMTIVRNVLFEPGEDRGYNPVDHALAQVAAAFYWHKPAIISSHRVNYCGHIDPEHRRKGLDALRRLLAEIIRRWPDVEFVSADQLVRTMLESYA